MVAGYWPNNDGLYLQYGTSKAVPEVGGDYVSWGDWREVEIYVSLGNTTFGPPTSGSNVFVPALPSSFSGTTNAISAGIQSLTVQFPLQTTTPQTAGNASTGGLFFTQRQLFIDTIEVQCLVTANAGSGGATGLTGIGLAFPNSTVTPMVFTQVTPNAGVQFLGSISNAAMTAGATYTFRANANNAAGTGGAGYIQYSTANTATITAGSWLGNVPLVTNAVTYPNQASPENPTGLPAWGYISAVAAGGTYTGANAAGLLKLRIRYNYYGNIAQ